MLFLNENPSTAKKFHNSVSMVAKLKFQGIDGRAPPGVELRLNLTQQGKPHPARIRKGLTD